MTLLPPPLALLALFAAACTPPGGDTGVDTDTGPDLDTGWIPTDTGGEDVRCVGDDDGSVDMEEYVVEVEADIHVLYTVNSPGTTVDVPDLEGDGRADGTRYWDFSAVDDEADETWSAAVASLSGTWFEGYFPDATYYVGIDASEETYGVYEVDEEGERLLLSGMVSATEGDILLEYTEPVVVFEFPVVAGKSWSSDHVEAVGTYEGVEYPYDSFGTTTRLYHTYAFSVDEEGVVEVPAGSFDVLRVDLAQEFVAENSFYGEISSVEMRAAFFLAECTGLVARVRSEEGATRPDFERATEYLRLGF